MKAPIDSLQSHKDLGVMMSADGTFSEHINCVIKKVKKRIGWLCRTFYSRDLQFMRQMYISVIRPHIDYCSQLWGPGEGPLLDRLERLQAYFTRLIPSIRSLSYVDRLKALRLQSIQRRFDQYKITYIRKILMNLVPNPGIKQRTDERHRLGLTLEVPEVTSKLRSDSFIVSGPRTFNCIPKELRKLEVTMETFKEHLDQFLSFIPDIPRYQSGESNRLDFQIRNWKWTLF